MGIFGSGGGSITAAPKVSLLDKVKNTAKAFVQGALNPSSTTLKNKDVTNPAAAGALASTLGGVVGGSAALAKTLTTKAVQVAAPIVAKAIINNPLKTATIATIAPTAGVALVSNPKIISNTAGAYIDLQKTGINIASGDKGFLEASAEYVKKHPVATAIIGTAVGAAAAKSIPGLASAGAVVAGNLLDNEQKVVNSPPSLGGGTIGTSAPQTPSNGIVPLPPQTKSITPVRRVAKKSKQLNTSSPVRVTNKIQIINAPSARAY